ncbi:MAG: enoyl-CoA hydratase-related protein [Actinomycetota bacterium]
MSDTRIDTNGETGDDTGREASIGVAVHEAGFTVERRGRVAILTLRRPEVLNALNGALMRALVAVADDLDADPGVGCLVITGVGRAFAAGADIGEMGHLDFEVANAERFLAGWDRLAAIGTPKIAAVTGYALGGGCELALLCDFIIADTTARFGQPEIKLGLIPGMGGTQRLTKAVGKQLAMDLILTGRLLGAERALQAGLVARVVEEGGALDEAVDAAGTIAGYAELTGRLARQAVNRAEESGLSEGLAFERQVYYATFGTAAAAEGIAAFQAKRDPDFHPPTASAPGGA